MMQLYPANVLEQAKAVIEGWQKVHPDQDRIGEISMETFNTEFKQAESLIEQIGKMGSIIQLSELYQQCDEMLFDLWKKTRRVRAIVRQEFGEESPEYIAISGTALRSNC